MRHTIRIVAAADAPASAGSSQIGTGEPGPEPRRGPQAAAR
jgi:hypothetical protein